MRHSVRGLCSSSGDKDDKPQEEPPEDAGATGPEDSGSSDDSAGASQSPAQSIFMPGLALPGRRVTLLSEEPVKAVPVEEVFSAEWRRLQPQLKARQSLSASGTLERLYKNLVGREVSAFSPHFHGTPGVANYAPEGPDIFNVRLFGVPDNLLRQWAELWELFNSEATRLKRLIESEGLPSDSVLNVVIAPLDTLIQASNARGEGARLALDSRKKRAAGDVDGVNRNLGELGSLESQITRLEGVIQG